MSTSDNCRLKGIEIVSGRDGLFDAFHDGGIVISVTSTDVHPGLSEHEERSAVEDTHPTHCIHTPAIRYSDYVDLMLGDRDPDNPFSSDDYNPLLWRADSYTRLAYLFGCLNKSLTDQVDCYYTFWYRDYSLEDISLIWRPWFIVLPINDDIVLTDI